jgi:hypothetical protein
MEVDNAVVSKFNDEGCRLASIAFFEQIQQQSMARHVLTRIEPRRLGEILERYCTEWTLTRPLTLWTLILSAIGWISGRRSGFVRAREDGRGCGVGWV